MSFSSASFVLFLALCIVAVLAAKKAAPAKTKFDAKGIVLFNANNFRKVVPHSKTTTVLMIWRKSTIGDYGADSMREDYYRFAMRGEIDGESDDVVFSQLIVEDGASLRLSEELGVPKNFINPKLMLFKAGESQPVHFPSTRLLSVEATAQFIAKHSNFYLVLPGMIKDYAGLVREFKTADKSRQEAILAEIETKHETLNEKLIERSQTYIKTMKGLIENPEYANEEEEKLEKIIKSETLDKQTVASYRMKFNIVSEFLMA